jgi:hypothetical protein
MRVRRSDVITISFVSLFVLAVVVVFVLDSIAPECADICFGAPT